MKHKKNQFIIYFVALSMAATTFVFPQSFFWQPTHLDSVSVFRLATNARGDIFAINELLSGSPNLYRSTDDGTTWDTLDIGNPYPYILSLLTIPNNGLIAGTA